MTPLFRVRLPNGTEGDVLHVELGTYTIGPMELKVTGHVGLLLLDDKTLTSCALEKAEIIRKEPVKLPIPGGGK